MSEFELEDLVTSSSLAAVEVLTVYITITTAYLIAAYLAGRQLSPTQTLIVTVLYVGAATMMTWACFGYSTRAIGFVDQLEMLNPDNRYGAQPFVRNTILVVQALGIVASLKFMWDVRHPRTE